jgi:Ca-activated chloride channel family protein
MKQAQTYLPANQLIPLLLILFMLTFVEISRSDSGVLINTASGAPDDATLIIRSMKIDVTIDNQQAMVKVEQIFQNQTDQMLEGQYIFDLPGHARVADFAVWDGLLRIPAVIMEEHHGAEVYERIKRPQEIDPGLLQQDDQYGGDNAFKVKVTPIPAYGTKRLELTYSEFLAMSGLTVQFHFPLKPSGWRRQHVENLAIHLKILSALPLGAPELLSKTLPFTFRTSNEHEIEGDCQLAPGDLKEDLVLRYPLRIEESRLGFSAYRAPERVSAYDLRDPALAQANPDGYFQATASYNQTKRSAEQRQGNQGQPIQARRIIILLDNSLSMHGEKIVRAYEAIDFFLHRLQPQDRFNIILFNETITPLAALPQAATLDQVERALRFVRDAPLESGTALLPALQAGLEQIRIAQAAGASPQTMPPPTDSIVLISDGNPTLDLATNQEIVAAFDEQNHSAEHPRSNLQVFAIGGDANQKLLADLVAQCHGYFVQFGAGEDLASRLGVFFDTIGQAAISNIAFQAEASQNFSLIYPLDTPSHFAYDGASFSFVGRYQQPQKNAQISILGRFNQQDLPLTATVELPAVDHTHDQLPRLWASARVEALLREIDLNGESSMLISEIIKLSQKYKFITPYTSLIAAPRALLRPRVIQPGDPVIRVRTDSAIRSMSAVLPFGLVLPLTYLAAEDVWEVRFLAPANLADGTYPFRLILTDKNGNGFQETKSFIIDSQAPRLTVKTDKTLIRAGEALKVLVDADRDTLFLTARLYGAQPVRLQWSAAAKCSVGVINVPLDLPPGQYSVVVAAEDAAHNNSTAEIEIEVR